MCISYLRCGNCGSNKSLCNDGSFEFDMFKIAVLSHAEKRKKKTSTAAALITTRGALKCRHLAQD